MCHFMIKKKTHQELHKVAHISMYVQSRAYKLHFCHAHLLEAFEAGDEFLWFL